MQSTLDLKGIDMKCKWHKCSNESRTRSEFCSDTCSKRHRRKSDKPGQNSNPDTEVGQAEQGMIDMGFTRCTDLSPEDSADLTNCIRQELSEQDLLNEVCPPNPEIDPDKDYSYLDGPANLEDYHDETHGRRYSPRTEPDKLNWGPWMDMSKLKQAGLKANRVSIPGDWDYAEVA